MTARLWGLVGAQYLGGGRTTTGSAKALLTVVRHKQVGDYTYADQASAVVTSTRSGVAVSGLLALGVLTAVQAPANADTNPPTANDPANPETVAAKPLPTVQIDGVAWTQAIVGNTVYVGGAFTTARPAGSAPGVNT